MLSKVQDVKCWTIVLIRWDALAEWLRFWQSSQFNSWIRSWILILFLLTLLISILTNRGNEALLSIIGRQQLSLLTVRKQVQRFQLNPYWKKITVFRPDRTLTYRAQPSSWPQFGHFERERLINVHAEQNKYNILVTYASIPSLPAASTIHIDGKRFL